MLGESYEKYMLCVCDDVYTWENTFNAYQSYPRFQLTYVTSGDTYWNINNTRHHVREGDMILLSSVDWRQFEQLPEGMTLKLRSLRFLEPWAYFPEMSIFYLRPSGFDNVLPRDHAHFEPVVSLFRQIADCVVQGESKLDEKFINAAMALLYVHLQYIFEPLFSKSVNQQNKLLLDTYQYIAEHISSDLSVDTIAGALYCSPEHLSRTFHRLSGIRLLEYIRRIRVMTVLNRLRQSDETVLDAALACGFRSASGFYKAFHTETGMSPKEYLELV